MKLELSKEYVSEPTDKSIKEIFNNTLEYIKQEENIDGDIFVGETLYGFMEGEVSIDNYTHIQLKQKAGNKDKGHIIEIKVRNEQSNEDRVKSIFNIALESLNNQLIIET